MLNILIRIFIKNSEDTMNPAVREKYGVLCGGYGIFLNLLLFAGKYLAGILSASIAMTADAFNNLSDAGSSLISVIGFKLAGQKPDPEHPFGHGRVEYLTGLGVSAIIIVMGYEFIKDSFYKILHPEELAFSWISVAILLASIMVKCYMAFYSRRIGKRIESETILATSTDSLSDCISTAVVLVATLVHFFFDIHLDGICGLLVGVLIIIAGVKAAKATINPLLGAAPSEEFVDQVEKIVRAYPQIVGIHDLIVHDYGPGRVMITLHAEVPNTGDINDLHDIVDNAEADLKKKLDCHAVIHMDPVAVGDPETDALKNMVKEIVQEIDESLSIHDFRIVKGPSHTNLIFDTVVPYKVNITDENIKSTIRKKVFEKNKNMFCVITVDRDYTGKMSGKHK